MKTTPTRSRKSATINNSRWLSYATAGAASAFAAAHSAEGTIHYSGTINQQFKGCGKTATFQLDRAGDFLRLRHTSLGCSSSYSGAGFFNVRGRAGASIAGFYSSRYGGLSASNLKRGQLISNRPFIPAQQSRSAVLGAGVGSIGQFNGGIGYVGFKFNNGSGDQYGWVRIQTRQGDIFHHFILRDYAYGDVGDRIKAGQKSSSDIARDQSSLGWLALGAVGLLAWRRTRQK